MDEAYIALPRRFPLAALITAAAVAIGLAFGAGSWAWAVKRTQDENTQRLDSIDQRWSVVQAYMCMECSRRATETGFDCRYICGMSEELR